MKSKSKDRGDVQLLYSLNDAVTNQCMNIMRIELLKSPANNQPTQSLSAKNYGEITFNL